MESVEIFFFNENKFSKKAVSDFAVSILKSAGKRLQINSKKGIWRPTLNVNNIRLHNWYTTPYSASHRLCCVNNYINWISTSKISHAYYSQAHDYYKGILRSINSLYYKTKNLLLEIRLSKCFRLSTYFFRVIFTYSPIIATNQQHCTFNRS